jgi:hypothetical protein
MVVRVPSACLLRGNFGVDEHRTGVTVVTLQVVRSLESEWHPHQGVSRKWLEYQPRSIAAGVGPPKTGG